MAETIEVRVPDIGDFHDVPVIEVLVKPGDRVEKDAPLITLESEKATLDVPSPYAGVVHELRLRVGDKVSQGTPILTLAVEDGVAAERTRPAAPRPFATPPPSAPVRDASIRGEPPVSSPEAGAAAAQQPVHASPLVRKLARERGIDLRTLAGTGAFGRITRDDLDRAAAGPAGAAVPFAGLPPWPRVDFERFGPIERVPLPRIKRIAGPNLHRNWLSIPHITNEDEADVTDLEAFRTRINDELTREGGPKLTILAFLVKAAVAALRRFPEFNASLDGETLILKRYYHIGFAADTPHGLVVPVIRDADRKGLREIAAEAAELAAAARAGTLSYERMQGGTFSISSIGGIGGTRFTQIVNAPEVAILGATRVAVKPVWDGTAFVPRKILPITVSYDHRVIDGAGAARFLRTVADALSDPWRLLL